MQYYKWLFLVGRLSVGLWHAICSLRCAFRRNSCGNKEQRGLHYRKELYNLCSGQSFDLGHPQQSAWCWVKWISEVRQIMEGWHCQKVGQNVSQGRGVWIVTTAVCPSTLFSLLLHVNSYSRSFRISEGPSSLKKIRKGRISPYSWSLSFSTTDRFFFFSYFTLYSRFPSCSANTSDGLGDYLVAWQRPSCLRGLNPNSFCFSEGEIADVSP